MEGARDLANLKWPKFSVDRGGAATDNFGGSSVATSELSRATIDKFGGFGEHNVRREPGNLVGKSKDGNWRGCGVGGTACRHTNHTHRRADTGLRTTQK
jgi:hypothetical protein